MQQLKSENTAPASHFEMQETSQLGTTKSSDKPGWYQIYFAALLERDQEKAVKLIEDAQCAIRYRLEELRGAAVQNSREPQDLGSALTYLGILLDHIGDDSGRLLWD